MFTIGNYKVIPNVSGTFKRGQEVGIYAQIYNAGIDQTTLRPSVDVEYALVKDGKDVYLQKEDWQGLSDAGQRLTLARLLPTDQLAPGNYEIASASPTASRPRSRRLQLTVPRQVAPNPGRQHFRRASSVRARPDRFRAMKRKMKI